jgi:diguanylate cyclase
MGVARTEETSDGSQTARSDLRLFHRSRLAGLAMVLVLLAVSAFAVWSSQDTGEAATRAAAASRISDDYAEASSAISAEESLERKYRLEPGPAIESAFDQAAADFVAAMGRVRRDGGPLDRTLVDGAVARHRTFLVTMKTMFRARDRHQLGAVLRIDREADLLFAQVEDSVGGAADAAHATSLRRLAYLTQLQRLTRVLTPLVFVLGLLLAAVLALVAGGHRQQLVRERAQALRESLHDPLSGLPNRRLLNDRLDQLLREDAENGTRTGLLLIDIDRFKDVNDTFGHQYGDELLRQVGPRLSGVLRGVDMVARLGGDEFAVLLPAVESVVEPSLVAVQLRAALQPSFRVFGVDLNIAASIGVVISGEHGQDATTLLQRADIAMYAAKAQGIGVCSYSSDINQHSPARLALLGELRKALIRQELVVHYQPKIAVRTGELVGVEALVRWDHASHGLIYPDEFIPLAEHTELIGPLTRYVLDTTLNQIRIWSESRRPITVSVNISARNLLDEHLPDMVGELLTRHGVPPELLVLEVTESALMNDPHRARQILERLAAMGVRISIDDFGVGYTSLGKLTTLPISELKIDKSFVMTMTEDSTNAVIVQSVIDLGHNLGLTIVAEGVENPLSLLALKRYGCDVAQGYHFACPVSASTFDVWRAEYETTHAPVPA